MTILSIAQEETVSKQVSIVKTIASCMIGNALEWYDFVIYGYFSTILSKLFFPTYSSTAKLIATWGIFWIGFITRPVGSILFGYIGDKFSRKKALIFSIYFMAIPTALIGCLPTYLNIGTTAAILLAILRGLQGLAIGGEFTGSILFITENAPNRLRGFYGSWAAFSLAMGIIFGSVIAQIFNDCLSASQLESWGWRIPFFLSLLGSVVGAYMRRALSEPALYLKHKQTQGTSSKPIKELIFNHTSKILLVIGLDFLTAVGFFIVIVFLVSYFINYLGIASQKAFYINTCNMVVFSIFILIGGWLSDCFGRKKTLALSCLGFIAFSYPLFYFFKYDPFLAQMLLAILMGIFFGVIPATLSEIFPTSIRYSGLSLGHNISMAIFGGGAPYLATKLIQKTGNIASPALLLVVAALLSFIFITFIKERSQQNLNFN